jgi:hypothetical protein
VTKGRFDTPSHRVSYLVVLIMTQAINPELLKTPWHFKVKKYTGYAIGWLIDRLPNTVKSYVTEYFELKRWASQDKTLGQNRYIGLETIWLKGDDNPFEGKIDLTIKVRHKHDVNAPKAELNAILAETKAKLKALGIQ